jgi:hypothetical protein
MPDRAVHGSSILPVAAYRIGDPETDITSQSPGTILAIIGAAEDQWNYLEMSI